MTEDVHDEALRRYTEAAATLKANLRRMIDQTPPAPTAVGGREWCAELGRSLYFHRRALGMERRPPPVTLPSGCYEASFGWVHVRPGCHCPR